MKKQIRRLLFYSRLSKYSKMENDDDQWVNYWKTHATFWEMGNSPPALRSLVASNKVLRTAGQNAVVFVPGCGTGHDVFTLAGLPGVRSVTGLDVVEEAISAANRTPKPANREVEIEFAQGDFFKHKQKYNIILDHTFLCALHPRFRQAWATKMGDLLEPGGLLITYMFPLASHLLGPPYALSVQLYEQLLTPDLELIYCEDVTPKFHTWKETIDEKIAIWKKVDPTKIWTV